MRLYDRLYGDNKVETDDTNISDVDRIVEILKNEGPKPAKELQAFTKYKSRSQFLAEVINPLIEAGVIFRDGNAKSPTALIKIKNKGKL